MSDTDGANVNHDAMARLEMLRLLVENRSPQELSSDDVDSENASEDLPDD